MHLRITLARFLLRLGEFIQTLPLVVMTPDDLVEFSRQSYARSHIVESWSEDAMIDRGLSAEEQDLLKAVPTQTGDLLVLGVGGGREIIPLARMGFRVTGVDYVPEMVARAKENAARRGVLMQGLVQEISRLDVPECAYDVVMLSCVAYSCVPGRARRVNMLRRIERALKPGGYFIFQYHRDIHLRHSAKLLWLRRLVAAVMLGNTAYEEGDMLWGNVEFLHAFQSADEIKAELDAGGLSVVRIQTELNPVRCGVVAQKAME